MAAERDWSKLDELILYVSRKCAGDASFGMMKLYKVLFYSDFLFYLQKGRSITGEDYIAAPQGPLPCHVKKRIPRLQKAGKATVLERTFHARRQDVVFAQQDPNLEIFDGAEIAVVDQVIEGFYGMTGAAVSNLSHEFAGWQQATMGEKIPYASVLVKPAESTPEKIAYAQSLEPLAQECLQRP